MFYLFTKNSACSRPYRWNNILQLLPYLSWVCMATFAELHTIQRLFKGWYHFIKKLMYKSMRIFILHLVAFCHYDKISEIIFLKIYFIYVYMCIFTQVYASCVNLVHVRYKSRTFGNSIWLGPRIGYQIPWKWNNRIGSVSWPTWVQESKLGSSGRTWSSLTWWTMSLVFLITT